MKTKEKLWWPLSIIVSILLTVILILLWREMNQYRITGTQLVNEAAVESYLNANWVNEPNNRQSTDPLRKLKTGVFVQSIHFLNATDVNLTGYIWQHYDKRIHQDIIPPPEEAGFILPEQVDSGSSIAPRQVYRKITGPNETIVWYFEATLRQPFEYAHYPFDHKTVWVRMWPKDFYRNVVLIPDLQAYTATGQNDIFGIEDNIVLGTWEREDTYFSYELSSYNTNFGIQNYIGQKNFPELRYNFVIKRKFENAFIVHLLPLFLVSALLFATLLTVSGHPELVARHGFNTSGLIAACSALFFVVLLAHIQLRETFAGTGIVYIEYFYFWMYTILVLTAANTYMFCMKTATWLSIIHYRDNLIPKVLYWPVVLGGMVVLTMVGPHGGY